MDRSYVVTGGGSGVGQVIAERLLADGGAVVVLDRDQAVLGWASAHPAGRRVIPLVGDAATEEMTEQAADLAEEAGGLAGWVNNAAVFRDAWLDAVPAHEVVELITANLSLAVTGCATAVRRFLAAGAGGGSSSARASSQWPRARSRQARRSSSPTSGSASVSPSTRPRMSAR